MNWQPIFIREMILVRRRLAKMLLSMAVSPLLFLIAFGWGLGRGASMDGQDYLSFLVPGLMAMASMNRAFAISSEINIARFYWGVFEEFQAAPIQARDIVAGETLAGCVRGLMGAAVVYVLGLLFGVDLWPRPMFLLALGLNSFLFSALAVGTSMVVRSHADQSMLSNFFITPMAFLCGTFFSVDKLPGWAASLIELLPLTHTTRFIRAAAAGQPLPWTSIAVGAAFAVLFFFLAVKAVRLAQD